MLEDEVYAIVSRYLRRLRRGGNGEATAICPFHRKPGGGHERVPSFSLNLSKGVYFCHSCHASGNMHVFLREMGIPRETIQAQYQILIDALAANRVDRRIDPLRPRHVISEDPLPEAVLGVFDECPLALVDPDYRLEDDDPVFDEALLQLHDIGFDKVHNRITFPLRDLWGNLVGVSGRTVTGTFPRYKVYDKEYEAFDLPVRESTHKGAILWNAHNVYNSVFFSPGMQRVILVEGFKACLWMIQAGFRNTLAMLGSHLSMTQKWILERLGAQVYVMMDNDPPGRRALEGYMKDGKYRPGIAQELSTSLDVFIVPYGTRQPTGLTFDEVHRAVDAAVDYCRWGLQQIEEKRNHVIVR